ncbi:MAG: hypothetical protein AABX99_01685 [Nanoarchaeota archaeon]
MFLQNTAGQEDISIKAKISGDSEFVKITDSSDIYLIQAGKKTTVNLKAIIPKEAKAGERYPVNIEFATMNEQTGGFGFGTAIGQNFEILITREDGTLLQSANSMQIIFSVMAVIFAIVMGMIIFKKRKH